MYDFGKQRHWDKRPNNTITFSVQCQSDCCFFFISMKLCPLNLYLKVKQSAVNARKIFCNGYVKKFVKRDKSCGETAHAPTSSTLSIPHFYIKNQMTKPPHSPDQIACDFFLFSILKSVRKWHRFLHH